MSRIFISYKRVDKEKVFKIKDQIESALGEKCWIDLDGIESDAQFAGVIIQAIDEAEVVLFMHSKAHTFITNFENDWTVREINYAKEENKKIVFINIDDAPLTKWFKFMFPQKQLIDGTSKDNVNKLCSDLRIWLNIMTVQPSNLEVSPLNIPKINFEDSLKVMSMAYLATHVSQTIERVKLKKKMPSALVDSLDEAVKAYRHSIINPKEIEQEKEEQEFKAREAEEKKKGELFRGLDTLSTR